MKVVCKLSEDDTYTVSDCRYININNSKEFWYRFWDTKNVFPVFYKFQGGGKGVSVCGAMMTMLDYRVFLILFGIFLLVFLLSRMVSMASIIGVISMSVSTAILYHGQDYWWLLFMIVTAMAIGVIIRHFFFIIVCVFCAR